MKALDTVSVLIPIKAEYVSIARLTASGIAHRAGFDIDTIEDIKVAISEVLGKIIEKCSSSDRVNIDFTSVDDGILITVYIPNRDLPELFSDEVDKFALAIICSLMDEMKTEKQDNLVITMVKKLGKAV